MRVNNVLTQQSRTIGSLTHKDFGRLVTVPGHGPGVLWSIQHVAAVGDIPEPWTRIIMRPQRGGGSEATRGLPPSTIIGVGEMVGLDVDEPAGQLQIL